MDLRRCLEPLLAGFYEDFEQAGFQVTVELMEDPPAVSADPGAVTRILTNLIGNALKHGSKTLTSGCIRRADAGHRLLQRRAGADPGGPAPGVRAVYTADQMRTGQNTGLGLAIVKALTEQMGHAAFARAERRCVYGRGPMERVWVRRGGLWEPRTEEQKMPVFLAAGAKKTGLNWIEGGTQASLPALGEEVRSQPSPWIRVQDTVCTPGR